MFLAGIKSFEIGNDFNRIALLSEMYHAMAVLTRGGVQYSDGFFNRRSIGGPRRKGHC